MSIWLMGTCMVLAQANANAPPKPESSIFSNPMVPLIGMVVLFYFFLLRPANQRRKQEEERLNQIKKNDRVRTIGGIMGVVTGIKEDKGTKLVTVRIDESKDVKITLVRSAIAEIITDKDEKTSD